MCRLNSKINGRGPVVEIDLTAAVEHLYGRRCLLLWLGWVDICCRGRSGHDCETKSDRIEHRHHIGATVRPTGCTVLANGPKEQPNTEWSLGTANTE